MPLQHSQQDAPFNETNFFTAAVNFLFKTTKVQKHGRLPPRLNICDQGCLTCQGLLSAIFKHKDTRAIFFAIPQGVCLAVREKTHPRLHLTPHTTKFHLALEMSWPCFKMQSCRTRLRSLFRTCYAYQSHGQSPCKLIDALLSSTGCTPQMKKGHQKSRGVRFALANLSRISSW